MLSFEQCFILFCSFPLLFAFVVGGLGFEFCVFVAGWRHALRSEWPFIIIIIITALFRGSSLSVAVCACQCGLLRAPSRQRCFVSGGKGALSWAPLPTTLDWPSCHGSKCAATATVKAVCVLLLPR